MPQPNSQAAALFGDPFAGAFGGTFGAQPDREPPVTPPLTPEEQQSLLGKIGSTALHGLGYIGSSIGKLGRAVRGGLGGRPEELLAAIPFSDALGITDPANEVSGSELLGNKDASFLSPEGIGGLGLEVITDPLTYLSFGGGALTKLGGQAAKLGLKMPRGGTALAKGFEAASPEAEALARSVSLGSAAGPASPKAIADVAGKALGGHVGVGLPFMGNAATFDLSGPASKALDALRMVPGASTVESSVINPLIEATAPVRRGVSALFEYGTKGQTGEVEQGIARSTSAGEAAANEAAQKSLAPYILEVQQLAGLKRNPDGTIGAVTPEIRQRISDINQKLRTAVELTGSEATPAAGASSDLLSMLGDQAAQAGSPSRLQQFDPEIQDLARRIRGTLDDLYARKRQAGVGVEKLPRVGEFSPNYAPRQGVEYGKQGAGAGGIRPSMEKGRLHELFGDMLTEDINRLSTDPTMLSMTPLQRESYILDKYLHFGPNEQKQFDALEQQIAAAAGQPGMLHAGTPSLSADQMAQFAKVKERLSSLKDQAKNLSEAYGGWDVPALQKVGGLFGNDFLADLGTHLTTGERKINQARNLFQPLANIAQVVDPTTAWMEEMPRVKMESMLDQLGLTSPERGNLIRDSLANVGIDLGQTALSNIHVPEDIANNILHLTKGQAPAGAGPILSAYDSFLNLLKAGQTAWPGTLGRNFLSDIAQRWFHGGSALSPIQMAKTAMEGGVIPGIAQKIGFAGSDAEAMQQIARLAFEKGLNDTRKFQTLEAVGNNPLTDVAQRLMPTIGAAEPGLFERIGSTATSINPLNVRGVAGREASTFAPVAAAQSTQAYSEQLNRLGTFIDAMTQGLAPEAAMQRVTNAHFDFSRMTPFDRDVMRRIVPYYSWIKQSIPASASEILSNPGGRMAQTMRILNEASGQQGFLPDYMTQTGFAMPMGDANEQGNRTYLTSLGLPFEDLATLTNPRSMIGSLAPFPRLPFELAMGQQAFSGRDMPNNYPMPGSPTLNMLAMNSPLSRVLSTWRNIGSAIDHGAVPQAALQTLLGPRLTTIDPAQAQRSAVRDFAEQQLQANPAIREFHRLYVPREQAANLSQQEMMLLRLLATRQQAQPR